jgi:hypothetical protein
MAYLHPEELEIFISPLILDNIYHTELARSYYDGLYGDKPVMEIEYLRNEQNYIEILMYGIELETIN